MSKETKIIAVFFVVLALGTANLRAEIIEINITAEIAQIDDPYGLLNGQLIVGGIITGSYIYDSATLDSQPSAPAVGDYWHYSSPYGISLSGGGFTFQTDPDNVEFIVEIVNNNPYDDGYLLRSYNNLSLYYGVSVGHISWQLDDSTGTALSSDALPTTPPVLEDWDFDWGIRITGGIPDEEGKFIESFSIRAPVITVKFVPYQPKTYYVNATNGSDDNDGLSPETAFATIQKAIDSAFNGDTVLVANGTYTGEGNRDIDFLGKAITVLSENGPENCIIDCNATEDDRHRGFYFHSNEDVYSVIDGFTIINGYPSHPKDGGAIYCRESSPTISNCIIKLSTARGGGGILCRGSSPTIKNCTITDNFADSGGGIMCGDSSRPKITNCTITGNSASSSGGGIYCYDSNLTLTNCVISGNSGWAGGGIYSIISSSPMITDCTISGNTAHIGGGIICDFSINAILTNCAISGNSGWAGGGMNNSYSNPTLIHCIFSGNSAELSGGGMDNTDSNPTLIHCIFSGNSAELSGGGMDNTRSSPMMKNCIFAGNITDSGGGMNNSYSNPTLTNCTFAENSAFNGNALAFDSWQHQYPSNIQVTNSILADGGNEIWNNDNSTITITYSDVQGGWEGNGNINSDPCFVEQGYWDANDFWVEGDYHLLLDSPCMDAGDPNYIPEPNETDLDGNPRVVDGDNDGNSVVDMGAYERMPEPAELILDLADDVMALNLLKGITNSLEAKLNAALRALEDENENNDIAAINTLGAFINAVEAQRGNKIPEAEADALIAAAQEIIDLLSDG